MRKVWLLASALLAFLNFVKSQEVARTLYSTRYDNLDIDTILGSNRLVSNYVDCLLSRKPCPPEGKDLKRILPEALRTKCARCSPIQKENALKIITRLYYDYPDQYRALRERWDPSGEYHRRFEEYLRGLQFNQIGGNGATGVTGSSGGGNTVENGGNNDRPVRNDLDRQPATQSSNVQAIVVDPTLLASPPSPQPPVAVAPATERPRPAAPVAQILFPTTTDTSPSSITTTTAPSSTTTSTSTSISGPLELTSNSTFASIVIRPGGIGANSTDVPGADAELESATGPVVPVPVPQDLPQSQMADTVVQSLLQQNASAPFGTVPPDGPPSQAPLGQGAQLALQTPPDRQQTVANVDQGQQQQQGVEGSVDDGVGDQNLDIPLTATFDISTTTGRVAPRPTGDIGFDGEVPTAPPLVVVNRFGDEGGIGRPSIAPVPAAPIPTTTTTTTQRPTTTTVRQTRPVTRQTTSRNTQRTTTRFITRAPPQTPPPTPARTTTRTTTTTIFVQAPPQAYPTTFYERPQAPPRASPRPTPPPPPPPPQPFTAPPRPLYVPTEPPRTPPTQYGQTTPDSIIDHFFVPPSQAANAPLPPSPIVGLWNQLGTKIADTADAIAGMLKKTVDVLVTSHIQSHQRALRRI